MRITAYSAATASRSRTRMLAENSDRTLAQRGARALDDHDVDVLAESVEEAEQGSLWCDRMTQQVFGTRSGIEGFHELHGSQSKQEGNWQS